MTVGNCLRLIFDAQHFFEERDDLVLRAWRLKEQLENRVSRGIEQVGVPGKRIEDYGLVDEVMDQKAVDGD